MPGKTKNNRSNRRKTRKTRSQKGGLSILGWEPFKSDPNAPSSFEWPDWNLFKSDPNGKGFLDSINPFSSTKTNDSIKYSSLDSSASYSTPSAPAPVPSAPTPVPSAPEASLPNADYQGGKKSKSRKCHRKHKHTKCCKK